LGEKNDRVRVMASTAIISRRKRPPPIVAGGISRKEIVAFAEEVARRFRPLKVILFGSYAYGNPTPDSDVDLLVITPRGGGPRKATRIRLACQHHFPMDLLVRSPGEIRRRIEMEDPFMKEIISRGVVLYEVDHARVG
jgi:uncharacterized protein